MRRKEDSREIIKGLLTTSFGDYLQEITYFMKNLDTNLSLRPLVRIGIKYREHLSILDIELRRGEDSKGGWDQSFVQKVFEPR